MLDSYHFSKNTALECRDVAKSQLLANLPGWKKTFHQFNYPANRVSFDLPR